MHLLLLFTISLFSTWSQANCSYFFESLQHKKPLGIITPAHSKVRIYTEKDLRTKNDPETTMKDDHLKRNSDRFDSYLKRLLQELREDVSDEKTGGVVFYAASGFDSFTPATLFPHANTFIFLDQHPYLRLDTRNELPQEHSVFESRARSFFVSGYMDFMGENGPVIIANLRRAYQHFEVLEVKVFTTQDSSQSEPRVNAVIRFKTENGVSQLIYIHDHLTTGQRYAEKWWKLLFDQFPPNILLIKGSTSFWEEKHVALDEKEGAPVDLIQDIAAHIERQDGYILSESNSYSGFSSHYSLEENPYLLEEYRANPSQRFGYGHPVLVKLKRKE